MKAWWGIAFSSPCPWALWSWGWRSYPSSTTILRHHPRATIDLHPSVSNKNLPRPIIKPVASRSPRGLRYPLHSLTTQHGDAPPPAAVTAPRACPAMPPANSPSASPLRSPPDSAQANTMSIAVTGYSRSFSASLRASHVLHFVRTSCRQWLPYPRPDGSSPPFAGAVRAATFQHTLRWREPPVAPSPASLARPVDHRRPVSSFHAKPTAQPTAKLTGAAGELERARRATASRSSVWGAHTSCSAWAAAIRIRLGSIIG